MSEVPFKTRMAATHNAVQGAKFNADAAKKASEDGDGVAAKESLDFSHLSLDAAETQLDRARQDTQAKINARDAR